MGNSRNTSEREGATMPAVAILGGGRLAQAVGHVLVRAGADVRLWARREEARGELSLVTKEWRIAESIHDACAQAQLVVIAVPAYGVREVMAQYGDVATPDQIVLHGVRGVEAGFILPHQIVRQETCVRKIGALGGPVIPPEISAGRPITALLASRFNAVFSAVGFAAGGGQLHLHFSRDLVGVEVAGAISCVTALAVGMVDALDLGETARGVIMTHGLIDAARMGTALGADGATFAGLAGVGELIPRGVTSTSWHHRAGAALVEGKSLEQILSEAGGELEGVTTVRAAAERAEALAIELPLVKAVDCICRGESTAGDELERVLRSDIDLEAAFRGHSRRR